MREDWLKVALWIDSIPDQTLARCRDMREREIEARNRRLPEGSAVVEYKGKRWAIRPKGLAQGGGAVFYSYVFDCSGAVFAINERSAYYESNECTELSRAPNAMAEFSGMVCMRSSLDSMIASISEFVEFLEGRLVSSRVSRVDACADIYGENIWHEVNQRIMAGDYISRAQSVTLHKSTRLKESKQNIEGFSIFADDDNEEGYQVGRSAVIMRIYAKRWEIEKKGGVDAILKKAALSAALGFDPGLYDIVRFEAQLRGSKLREMGITTIQTYLERRRSMFEWVYRNHFRLLKVKYGNGNESKSPVHPIWKKMLKEVETIGEEYPLIATPADCDAERMLKAALGYMKTIAALSGKNADSVEDLLSIASETATDEMRATVKADVEKRREKIWGRSRRSEIIEKWE